MHGETYDKLFECNLVVVVRIKKTGAAPFRIKIRLAQLFELFKNKNKNKNAEHNKLGGKKAGGRAETETPPSLS